jgi:hypothetical protein
MPKNAQLSSDGCGLCGVCGHPFFANGFDESVAELPTIFRFRDEILRNGDIDRSDATPRAIEEIVALDYPHPIRATRTKVYQREVQGGLTGLAIP